MRSKQNQRKPVIFCNCKEVLQTVIIFYFAANLVFGEEEKESKFCRMKWSEFVENRELWERKCSNESHCCNETAKYLEDRYQNYIKLCPIIGKISSDYFLYLMRASSFVHKLCIALNFIVNHALLTKCFHGQLSFKFSASHRRLNLTLVNLIYMPPY